MRQYRVTPQARKDLKEIWEYIARDSIDRADMVLERIERALQRLARSPGVGHIREDLADEHHRFFPVFSYLIAYLHDKRPIQIVRVIHGARDVELLFQAETETQ